MPIELVPLLMATMSAFFVDCEASRIGIGRTFNDVSSVKAFLASSTLDFDILINAQSLFFFVLMKTKSEISMAFLMEEANGISSSLVDVIHETDSTGDNKVFCAFPDDILEVVLLILETEAADDMLAA